ncbi:MAG: 2-isopropylmalate synthase [Oscillospiraceae bacterium]|jgi:2-isopropylmalate synthase|nr:2-isopropylmalate synthase [Oscillospiraceae bacterium]
MNSSYQKYRSFQPIAKPNRRWPDRRIERAPIWCSVDLRDGNQALINPMNLQEKLEMFRLLCEIGVKEIEVGFPSASETEYEILRTLIEGGYIPDDVTVQVLVQAREHLIRRTFEAIEGAKNVIFHFYNSTSALQRRVVFRSDMEGIVEIAAQGARLIKQLGDAARARTGVNLRYEYSPESYMGTEPENALWVCRRVMEELGASAEDKVILNLPSTVENCLPSQFADLIEDFCDRLPNRAAAIISLHPHNDRGTATATAELGLLAGADRLEGTLFGNGERTGNCDMVNVAMNMFTQGVDPRLDFSDIGRVRAFYERVTKLPVHARHPYAGDLVFTAFSGSHQDAINKGHLWMREQKGDYWEIPYLPLDPADVGRQYEPVVRINSQSGKGGAAFVMEQGFGYRLPKAMHPEFGAAVKAYCDAAGREITPDEVLGIFKREYSEYQGKLTLLSHRFVEIEDPNEESYVHFEGKVLRDGGAVVPIAGDGNGPINAACNALNQLGLEGYRFVDYFEHAVGAGADATGVAYIQVQAPSGKMRFGVGQSPNINTAAVLGVLCAVNRDLGGE